MCVLRLSFHPIIPSRRLNLRTTFSSPLALTAIPAIKMKVTGNLFPIWSLLSLLIASGRKKAPWVLRGGSPKIGFTESSLLGGRRGRKNFQDEGVQNLDV